MVAWNAGLWYAKPKSNLECASRGSEAVKGEESDLLRCLSVFFFLKCDRPVDVEGVLWHYIGSKRCAFGGLGTNQSSSEERYTYLEVSSRVAPLFNDDGRRLY